jgi:hypothetical protein
MEDALMPFYYSIEMKTRKEMRGHTDAVTQEEKDWDAEYNRFRARQKRQESTKVFERWDADMEEGGR